MTRQYIFTERAHLMCPNMYFGIVETINSISDVNEITLAFQKLSKAHPFLRALLGYEKEKNQYYYDITDDSQIEIIWKDTEVSSIYDRMVFEEYERQTRRDWNLFQEGMLKAVCFQMQDKTCVLFIFHHLLADGRAALELALEFAHVCAEESEPETVTEQLIASQEDLPKGSGLSGISRLLIRNCNRKWEKEDHFVTYEKYHEFVDAFLQQDKVVHSVQMYQQEKLDRIALSCRKNNISINDFLLAKMCIEENTHKIIIAQDIREKLDCYKKGALGNYSTAFSIVCKTKSTDILTEAKRIHKVVRKNLANTQMTMTVLSCYAQMAPGLIDAAAISALGGFQSRAGAFVGSNMFGFRSGNGYSITNLGKYEDTSVESAMFIPPASPAMKKILGVLTMNGKMTICSSQR